MKLRSTLFVFAVGALVLSSAAAAHVEITPEKVKADSVARLTIEVPTELKVPTVKLEVKLPPGLTPVRPVAKAGWKSTNRNGVLTWFGGQIPSGRSGTFVFRAHMPDTPGKELVFPAVQTYANGEVVRWIDAPGSQTPAPRINLEAAPVHTFTVTLDDGSGNRRSIALGIGIALVAGLLVVAIVLFRRRRA